MTDEIYHQEKEYYSKNSQSIKCLNNNNNDLVIFVLSNNMIIESCSISANMMIEEGTFLRVNNFRLTGATVMANEYLNTMVSSANDGGYRSLIDGKLVRPSNPTTNWVSVSRRFGGKSNGNNLLMLTLRPLVKSEPLLGRELTFLFRLTGAEARLAAQLSAGFNLAEIADRNGVNISTLRAQLRSVYAKIGASKQSELVAHIWRAAGL